MMFRWRYFGTMVDNGSNKAAADERAERLAQALRDNLRRRKAQARAAKPVPGAAGAGTPEPVED